ncbi:hypothetical protein [Parasitella parasitica]|uniref:Reverse transcriptase domain-containing protein n=1 Tax=Parasitella parasitica TaxID=35722 RepID=A0A0B7NDL2_9FUNG|nr:hypothetical protein [Parasitella parasitica]
MNSLEDENKIYIGTIGNYMTLSIQFLYENGAGSAVDEYGWLEPIDYIVDEEQFCLKTLSSHTQYLDQLHLESEKMIETMQIEKVKPNNDVTVLPLSIYRMFENTTHFFDTSVSTLIQVNGHGDTTPDRNIAALLLHNDYVAEFKQLLETKRVHFVNNFDPWNGSTLKDPQYKDLSEQERSSKAHDIQQQRLERAVFRIREPVKFAVAHFFYQQKWLPKSFIDHLNQSRYGQPEDIFEMDEVIMDDPSDDTTTNSTHSNNKITENSSLLFITETWLLPPNQYLTTWKQFHTYGQPINSTHHRHRGHLGIALLINPTFKQHVHHIQYENPILAKYTLSVVISAKILIHCLYIPPNIDDNDLSEILELLPLSYNKTSATIVCGDFNARMGNYTGDTRWNHKGRLIYNWIQSNELINWNERIAFGIPTSYSYSGNSIVDYFLSTIDLENTRVIVRDNLSLESTHKLLTFSFLIPSFLPNTPVLDQRKLWNIKKLKNDKVYDAYENAFKEYLDLILPPIPSLSLQRADAQNYIEHINTSLLESIYKSLDAVCGEQTTDPAVLRSKEFWTKEMMDAFERKEFYYRKWRKANGFNCLKYWLLHQKTKAKLRRLVIQRRKETWRQFCDQMKNSQYTKAIAKFSRIRKNRLLKPVFSTIDGPQQATDIMADHLEQTLSGSNQSQNENIPVPHNLLAYHSSQMSSLQVDCSFDLESIKSVISDLPRKKAPGIDHITSEMIRPLPKLLDTGPTLHIAQRGFRESRGSLDQVLCLTELCQLYHRKHLHYNPVLAFLDIKSAYDTVDRNIIWNGLSRSTPTPLLNLLHNLFEDVSIEVILNNHKSSRFRPKTGVLQGSVLSPYLYSVYINSLPSFLRSTPLVESDFNDPLTLAPKLNCLLYADDVVLIADADSMQSLLSKCEEHSLSLGYRWNPKKCVIVDPNPISRKYYLYNSELPNEDYFPYLGVPIKSGGIIDKPALLQQNINKALGTMKQLASLGVNKYGFDYLISTRFYAQIVRPQLEYGLAITSFNLREIRSIENCQNQCMRQIFGGRPFTSTKKVMLHIANLPTMKDRISILQAQFLFRSSSLPDDALLSKLQPYLQLQRSSKWSQLSKSLLWKSVRQQSIESISTAQFKQLRRRFLIKCHQLKLQEKHIKLLSHCRNDLIVDPILKIPMTKSERSRCVRWRLGWLPLGKPQVCPFHPNTLFSRSHSFSCLNMHNRLQMPKSIEDPLSYLLNCLPPTFLTKKARSSIDIWLIRWPTICAILLEMDYLAHSHVPDPSDHFGEPFIKHLLHLKHQFSDQLLSSL